MNPPLDAGAPLQGGLRVLWTTPYLPWPTTNGGKVRQYALLRQMAARGHDITLLALCRDEPTAGDLAHLREFLKRVITVPRRSRTSPATLLRAAASLSRPVLAAVNGCAPEYERTFSTLLSEGQWDVLQVEHSYAFEPLARIIADTRARYVLTEHNVESRLVPLHWSRLPALLRPLAIFDQRRAEIWEQHVLREADCVVAVTKEDEAAFRALGAVATAMVPNSVETAAFGGVRPSVNGPLLFLGNYEYAPNVDAVCWLCEEIMPQVWALLPSARLAVRGHAMPVDEWRLRWPDPRIEFAGFAPSIATAHSEAAAFVAPLRAGGGSKLKVIEAMASGLPVIGTPQAMSGLAVRPGLEFVDGGVSTATFAAAAVAVLANPATVAAVGEAGRAHVVAGHDWRSAAATLEQVWQRQRAVSKNREVAHG